MAWTPQKLTTIQEVKNARAELQWSEDRIKSGFKDICDAIKNIYDKKSWRFDYPSFEDCCFKRWNMTKQRAHQLRKCASIRDLLLSSGDEDAAEFAKLANERTMREITSVPAADLVDVVKAHKKSGKPRTSKALRETITKTVIEMASCPVCDSRVARSRIKLHLVLHSPSTEIPDQP